MHKESLRDQILQAAHSRSPLTIDLSSGHRLVLTVLTCAGDWFSGESVGNQTVGAIIPLRSVVALQGEANIPQVFEKKTRLNVVFRAALSNLVTLRKHVRVYTPQQHWNGVLAAAFSDYLLIQRDTDDSVCISYAAVCWIAVV